MSTPDNNGFYRTEDMVLASVLFSRFPIVSVDKADPRRAGFIFDRSPELEKLVDSFYRRQLSFEPTAFFGLLKGVKARLYANS